MRGKTTPETWAGLAESWAKVPIPYQQAKMRWWQAQACLPIRAKRAEARRALNESWRIAQELPAAPLQRALVDLAIRGRITLPGSDLVAIPIEAEVQGIGRRRDPASRQVVDVARARRAVRALAG